MTERGVHTLYDNSSEFTGVVGWLFSEKLFQHSGRLYYDTTITNSYREKVWIVKLLRLRFRARLSATIF